MTGKRADSPANREIKRNLNGRILRNTMLNIVILVVICCVIMALSLQSLANSILLDSLQPMARQSAKTVEANVHMLADRMMTIAGDTRITEPADNSRAVRQGVLEEAAEIYELHTIGFYNLNGSLVQGIDGAPEGLDSSFFALLKETDNLTTDDATRSQGQAWHHHGYACEGGRRDGSICGGRL